MDVIEKHEFPDCLDHLLENPKFSYDDYHIYETLTCAICKKKVIWKYKLLGIFDDKGNLIKEV